MIASHEREGPALPSNRSFGLLFTVVFALAAGWLAWRGRAAWPWLAGLAALVALVTLLRPALLAPLNRAWMAFAALLHRVVSPLVLGVLYFLVIAPVALVMRAAGRDTMRRRFDAAAASYWIPRTPRGPSAESFRDPF